MNLQEIRRQVALVSGRYDLMNDDYTDNGLNFYINAGQYMLDKFGISKHNEIALAIPIEAGEYSVSFSNRCISVFEVWANDGTTRIRLDRVNLKDLKEYFSSTVSEIESDFPQYYALASYRALEAVDRDSLGLFLNLSEIDNSDYRGIILAPSADISYVIEVYGKFYSNELEDDDQENYWTLYDPIMLVKATLYQLYSTTGRARDAEAVSNSLTGDLVLLDKSLVEEDSYDITVMEG